MKRKILAMGMTICVLAISFLLVYLKAHKDWVTLDGPQDYASMTQNTMVLFGAAVDIFSILLVIGSIAMIAVGIVLRNLYESDNKKTLVYGIIVIAAVVVMQTAKYFINHIV